jgi:hypothetical protein
VLGPLGPAEDIPVRVPAAALALLACLLVASVALASHRQQRDTAHAAGPAPCAKKRTLALKGAFLAGGPESFQMQVHHASSHARALRGTRELRFDAQTTFRRNGGASSAASLQPNDRLHVLVRACKHPDAASMELRARRIVAHAPKTA